MEKDREGERYPSLYVTTGNCETLSEKLAHNCQLAPGLVHNCQPAPGLAHGERLIGLSS